MTEPSRETNEPPLLTKLLGLRALSDPRFVPLAIVFMFALMTLRMTTQPMLDPDVYWIAAGGRVLFETGDVPRINAWSISDANEAWVFHEWLVGAGYALLTQWITPTFVFAAHGILSALLAMLVFAFILKRRAQYTATIAITMLLALGMARGAFFQPRPSCTVFVFWLVALAFFLEPAFSKKRLVASIALSVVWANAHGSAPLGSGLLVLGLVAHWKEDDALRSNTKRRLIALGLSLIALVSTPYGIDLPRLVGRYLSGGDPAISAVHRAIVEFHPLYEMRPPFGTPAVLALIVTFTLLGLSEVVRGVSWLRRISGLLVVTLCAMALHQARHVFQAQTFSLLLLVPLFEEGLHKAKLATAGKGEVARVIQQLSLGMTASVLIALCALPFVMKDDESVGDEDFTSLVQSLPEGAHVYAGWNAAGHVIWLGAARGLRVLYDPRNDCYSVEAIDTMMHIEDAPEDVADALREADVAHVVLPSSHPVARRLRAEGMHATERGAYAHYVLAAAREQR
jgi:hypothetical protein